MKLTARGMTLTWPRSALVMGIVNLGADSFSGDGLVDIDAAVKRAHALVALGAEIIDIGAESARTNRAAISERQEAAQLLRFVERWDGRAWLSINTWRPAVARAVLTRGGEILNDIGALPTPENARICAETGCALLVMHSMGEPKIAHTQITYSDIMERLDEFFTEKLAIAEAAGLLPENILLDPGIDFAKQRSDNLRIYRELAALHKFSRPILLPVSRKTVIGEVLGISEPAARDAGTVACIVRGLQSGAAIFRVHDVAAAVQTIRTVEFIQQNGREEA